MPSVTTAGVRIFAVGVLAAGGLAAAMVPAAADVAETHSWTIEAAHGAGLVQVPSSAVSLDMVELAPRSASPGQQWTFQPRADGSFTVINRHSDLCLRHNYPDDEAHYAEVETCQEANAGQRWTIRWLGHGTGQLLSVETGECAAARTDPGDSYVALVRCDRTDPDQMWKFG